MINYSKSVPESYTGNEEDKNARFAWKIGSELEIYSRSEKEWYDGKIVDRFLDSEGEWLRIIYGKKTKSVQRFCADIKPLSFSNINESKNDKNPKQSISSISSISTISHSSISSSSGYNYIDEHGFLLSLEQRREKLKEIGSASHRNSIRKHNQRIFEWLHIVENWDTYNSIKKHKLKQQIRKGIPSALRALVWKKMLNVCNIPGKHKAYYFRIRYQEPAQEYKEAIDRDLNRTFPRHVLFSKNSGKESLRNVLYALANHDIELGYTQGMGYIAALLLMLMTEDEAFWCLCSILDGENSPIFAMRGLYLDGLPLLNLRYVQFGELLKTLEGKLHSHLEYYGIIPALYASKWFITNYCCFGSDGFKSFDFVYRIWDIYLYEGIPAIFRVSLALMKINEKRLLKLNTFSDIMEVMQDMSQSIEDIDVLFNKAFDLSLKDQHLRIINWKVPVHDLY